MGQKGWVGIDPGKTGAIAFIDENEEVVVFDYPGDERALSDLLETISWVITPARIVIESQQAFPGQGISSAFKLGVNYGMWLSAIAARAWPLVIIRPGEWKKGLGYPPKDKKASKAHSVTLVRQLYPQAGKYLLRVKDHDRAEAILLAHVAKGG
jgi:crossover junction endodeoxyribonuclease RuvC